MAVTLGPAVLERFRRFSLFNSPFVAHRRGRAIDLYPDGDSAPSPVAGEILETRTVRAPPKPYAEETDHLIVIDTGKRLARILHVEPAVGPGDAVEQGESLGRLVRAGYFAPWVPNHLHLGFRPSGADPIRASGSLPIAVDIPIRGLEWNGIAMVAATGETWARLSAPSHPAPGELFVGLAAAGGVLDGGLPHYNGGGVLGRGRSEGMVRIAGTPVGRLDGRDVAWDDVTILANGEPVTGLAVFAARDEFGVKLVGRGLDLAVGDEVRVSVSVD